MAKNVKQVYDANPSTTAAADDLFYLGQSPYTIADDSAIKYSDLFTQLALSFLQTTGSVTAGDIVIYGVTGQAVKSSAVNIDTSRNMTNLNSLVLGTPLALTSGGSGKSLTASNGGVVYTDADSMEILAGTATAGQVLRSGASSAPSWSTATYPSTAGTSGNVLTSDGTNWISSASPGMFPNGIVNVTGTTQTITPGTIYFANNVAQVVFTLPTSFTTAQNQCFAVIGRGAGGWRISCAVGTQMQIGNRSCTASTGFFQSNHQNDAVIFYPASTNTLYQAISVIGNISNDSSQIANAIDCPFTANQLLYSSSTGNLTGLATAASAQLVTNSSGVPALSASMTNGQVVVGSTGGTPAPATLTAGDGVTITNGANSITIAASSQVLNNSSNIITGGNFDTNPWQKGVSFAAIASGTRIADRFKWFQSGAGVVTAAQVNAQPSFGQAGIYLKNSIGITVTTADASIGASDYYQIKTAIEGTDWTQCYQQAMTCSFWLYATVTGNYGFTIQNDVGTRCFVAECNVTQAATWQFFVINIPADSTGVFNITRGTVGAYLTWTLAAGSNFQGSTGWQTSAGPVYCTSNQPNAMATNSNVFYFSLPYLQAGTFSNPVYPYESISEVLERCQRYYETSQSFEAGFYFPSTDQTGGLNTTIAALSTASYVLNIPFKVKKAIVPTITLCDNNASTGAVFKGGAGKTAAVAGTGQDGFNGGTSDATNTNNMYFQWQADAEIF